MTGHLPSPDALVREHEGLCRAVASAYYAPGLDHDDLVQEARLGVVKAARLFDGGRGIPFEAYARLSAEHAVQTAVKAAKRHKHEVVSSAVALDHDVRDAGESVRTLAEVIPGPEDDPLDQVLARESLEFYCQRAQCLTFLERMALAAYLNDDQPPQHTAAERALQRAKAKVLHGRAGIGTAARELRLAA